MRDVANASRVPCPETKQGCISESFLPRHGAVKTGPLYLGEYGESEGISSQAGKVIFFLF